MTALIDLGYLMLETFRRVVSFFSVELPIPFVTTEFWQNLSDTFVGKWLEKVPWISNLIDFLIDFLPEGGYVNLLGLMVGYGILVYVFFVFVKFILDIVL